MGACNFTDIVVAKSAEDAFAQAQDQARWEDGHGGYTGTIAEKPTFIFFGTCNNDPYKIEEAVSSLAAGRVPWSAYTDAEKARIEKAHRESYQAAGELEAKLHPRALKRYLAKLPKAIKTLLDAKASLPPRSRYDYRVPRTIFDVYNEKWGEAVCVEIGGKWATDIKHQRGYRRKRGLKVYLFCGMASC